MCDCVEELEEKIKAFATEQKQFKKPIKEVKLKGCIFTMVGNMMTTKTSSTFSIELEGQKKKVDMPVVQSFCPFCGEKKETA